MRSWVTRGVYRWCVVSILAFGATASAGQLHVEHYTLAHVARRGCAVLGVVTMVNVAAKRLHLRVQRLWAGEYGPPRGTITGREVIDGDTMLVDQTIQYVVGDTVPVDIYTGVEWTNPHKSPLDRRLWDHLRLSSIRVGQQVVVAGRELRAADSATMRKLDLFFDPMAMDVYRVEAFEAELVADLHDYELFDIACAELQARGEPLVPLLLATSPQPSNPHDPLRAYLDNLSGAERAGFWNDCVAWFRERDRGAALARVVGVVTTRIQPDDLPAIEPFLALVKDSPAVSKKAATELQERIDRYR